MDSSVDSKVNQPEQQTSSVIIIKDDKQKANRFDCKLCSRQYSSSQSYYQHKKSAMHQENL